MIKTNPKNYLVLWILNCLVGLGQQQLHCCHAQVQDAVTNNPTESRQNVLYSRDIPRNGSGYLFGIPPIQLDPIYSVPGIQEGEDFEKWVAPPELAKNFPYYLSGFDREGRPIWISEWGKYDITNFVVGDKNSTDLFEKYQRQACYAAIKSRLLNSTKERPVDRHIFILDFEGFKPEHISNPQVRDYSSKLARKYRRYFEKNLHKVVILNVNFVGEVLIDFSRPLFGRMLERIETYGTSKANYIPQLLKSFSKDQLPEWYGGNKGHKPIYVHG